MQVQRLTNKLKRLPGGLARRWQRLQKVCVELGAPPSWFNYRWIQKETVQEYFERYEGSEEAGRLEMIHPSSIASNSLPRNVTSRNELPADRGWWGFSFRDVPERKSEETFIATLPECGVAPVVDEDDEFWVTILNRDSRALELREISFRPWHVPVLQSSEATRLKKATWVLERVYHNYSHWLTAHLPKLLLLRRRGALSDVMLPNNLKSYVDESLRLYGFTPENFRTFEPGRRLEVEELTLLGTDRFRPELLRMVREDCPLPAPQNPSRRIYISRAKAPRRRLLNEETIWPILERAGFERVFMEDLSFEEQVRLMRETAILFAPHGAGLTNMMFCPEGTHVVEIANLSFPNPNFYAVAAAMGHHYWLLSAEPVGDPHPPEKGLKIEPGAAVHPLEKDIRIEPEAIEEVLRELV